ncbi:hypothetical protein [Leisingera sp. M658]|uniref:hypothetical protein n=1 Tax=Leisingera sp. M658 TaxID=2867015 RepID=UPI0021A364BA|nr:hypothetical protein [Leisingera sp. M658]UWQ74650.1 hypothetical protein K3724_19620 [Leisingera sp. M658]
MPKHKVWRFTIETSPSGKNTWPIDLKREAIRRFGALQNGKAWSEDLGYDFELKHDRRTWLIEVIPSQGDRCQFEMGVSEVRAAREAARPKAGQRYVVIYVANPATLRATRVDILPNPMSDEPELGGDRDRAKC